MAFGREGNRWGLGERGVMFTQPPRPDRGGSTAETAADPAGANNCFLSAGISVASGEDKLIAPWGHGTLTRLQPATCLSVLLEHNCQQQQHKALRSVNKYSEEL